MMNIRRMLLIILFGLLAACASTAPLPATLNIVPPESDIPPVIAAFSGIWEGQWMGFQDAILVVEKIDKNKAVVILSYGLAEGFEPRYFYKTAEVTTGPAIKWVNPNGDEVIFKIDKKLNKIYGSVTEKRTGAIGKLLLYKRIPK